MMKEEDRKKGKWGKRGRRLLPYFFPFFPLSHFPDH